jgi:hypothetical protein
MRGPMEAFIVGSVPYYMSRTNHASLLDVALILSSYDPFPPSSRQSVNFRRAGRLTTVMFILESTDACTVLKAIEFSTNVAPPQISTTLASR